MIFGIQIIGIIFALFMIYLTFLYYKRENYGKLALFVWMTVWLGFLILVSFPTMIYSVMDVLSIERTADFFVSGALLFFSVMIFKQYVKQKDLEHKIEKLVRRMAMEKAREAKKKIIFLLNFILQNENYKFKFTKKEIKHSSCARVLFSKYWRS